MARKIETPQRSLIVRIGQAQSRLCRLEREAKSLLDEATQLPDSDSSAEIRQIARELYRAVKEAKGEVYR